MAQSPAHRFGQIVGELLEEILDERLTEFCASRTRYLLDRKGVRPEVRDGSKLTWIDKYGNAHDLDFVIEHLGGTREERRPVAFIEAAWRRYTKHSKNKAQEIQGAILPIREHHHRDAPFLGAVLAGNFTKPALEQLRNQDFHVVHLSYNTIMEGMAAVGIDARFDEDTPDRDFARANRDYEALDEGQRRSLREAIVDEAGSSFDAFFLALGRTLDRQIDRIVILPLHGSAVELSSGIDAQRFLTNFAASTDPLPFQRFDITVRFSNDDEVRMSLSNVADALDFLAYILR